LLELFLDDWATFSVWRRRRWMKIVAAIIMIRRATPPPMRPPKVFFDSPFEELLIASCFGTEVGKYLKPA